MNYKSSKNKINIFKLLTEVYDKLSKLRKKQLNFLFIFMIFNGFAELLPLASVIPFLAVITNPKFLFERKIFNQIFNLFKISTEKELVTFVVLFFVITIIFAASVRLTNLFLTSIISHSIGSDISCELYKRNIYKPYALHLKSNSSEVINAALVHVDKTVEFINASLQLFSFSIISISLLLGLFIFNFKITLVLFFSFLISYLFLGFKVRKKLLANSNISVNSTNLQIKLLRESFGSIRDTIINGSQQIYLKIFRSLDIPLKRALAENKFLYSAPRFALEAIGLILIATIAYFITLNDSVNKIEPITILGTIGLGAQRLLPAVQGIYLSWAQINSLSASGRKTIDLLDMPIEKSNIIHTKRPIKFNSQIKIENLTFKYPNSNKKVLDSINLEISRGEKIGIIGETGCGKSTLSDVLMGLLYPSSGSLYIDNKKLDISLAPKRLSQWRASIAHVPQNIYLSDSSFAENIAFGVGKKNIDLNKVINSARKARIAEYIESTESQYNTYVGERGIRLSGGQKQRIGIARALYSNKKVLFLDEATSALDNDTEKLVMDSIQNLNEKITIIIIAHRKNTLSFCDRIILLKNGKIERID